MGQVISYHQKTLFFFQAWLPCFAFLCTAEALLHATKRDSGKIGGHVVLVISPFCSAIQAKWIGRPLTWLGDLQQRWVAVNWSLWSFCCLAFLNCGLQIFLPASLTFLGQNYRDARTSEKLQLTESAIIKQVCTRI